MRVKKRPMRCWYYFRMRDKLDEIFASYDYRFQSNRPFGMCPDDAVSYAVRQPTFGVFTQVCVSIQSRFNGKLFNITEIEDLR